VLQVCIGATIGKVGYVSNDVVTNQQINSVVGLEELDAYFVSLMLSTNELQVNICDRAGTTTLPIISKSAWGELSIPWPDAQIRKGISLLAKSIDEYVLTTDKAVADAKNLRSGLLSDLLSGEHEIPKAYDQFLRAA
jgi:type I restriction enzyme S subunit